MLKKKITVKNKLGLHARAAVKFVNLANCFGSSVRIEKDGAEIDGKSVSGKDEATALKALVALINNRFQEKE
jgi:phosphocarrier protein